MNTKRMNRLEELGRIDNEKMNKNTITPTISLTE